MADLTPEQLGWLLRLLSYPTLEPLAQTWAMGEPELVRVTYSVTRRYPRFDLTDRGRAIAEAALRAGGIQSDD